MEMSIMSQDKTLLGSFDIIEIDGKNIIGWSCHPKDPKRTLGRYNSMEIAKQVLDQIMVYENQFRNQSTQPNVFVMPGSDGK